MQTSGSRADTAHPEVRPVAPAAPPRLEGGIPLRALWDMPWTAALEVRRVLSVPWARAVFFCHSVAWGRRWRIYGAPIIQRHRCSAIHIGAGLTLRSWPASNPLAPSHRVVLATRRAEAQLYIGEDVGITGGTIVAAERVEIGDRVFIGANTTIADTDFHPLDPELRRADVLAGAHRPVHIEDDVFIGMNCLILKGVHIGAGAVVGAGSVVVKDVAAHTLVAGNPARVIRDLPRQVQEGLTV
jgi:acetyltransferase-like isoleucine patch superfamily enzyme